MLEDRKVKIFLITLLIALTTGMAVKSFVSFKSPPEPPVTANVPVAQAAPAEAEIQEIVVYVTGAVAKSGLVKLAPGSRLADALIAAGQIPEADLTNLNLAEKLHDGQKIVVPKIGEVPPVASVPAAGSGVTGQNTVGVKRVNINTATLAELDTLPGIGPATAEKIIAYRNEHGPFARPEDLKEVTGIGEKKYAELADLIGVD